MTKSKRPEKNKIKQKIKKKARAKGWVLEALRGKVEPPGTCDKQPPVSVGRA